MEPKKKQPITTGGAGYIPDNFGQGAIEYVRRKLYNNILPWGYNDIPQRVWNAVVLDKPEPYDDDNEGRQRAIRDDLWATYLQIPNKDRHDIKGGKVTLEQSPYRPKGAVQGKSTYRFKRLTDAARQGILAYAGQTPGGLTINGLPYLPINNNRVVYPNDINAYSELEGLGQFTVGRGRDNKGEYISYYDSWDLGDINDPYKDMSYGIGKPFNIYDRIYLDDYYNVPKKHSGGVYVPELTVYGINRMRRDPTEFRERFLRWKNGEQVYKAGLPHYEDGKDAGDDDTLLRLFNEVAGNKFKISPLHAKYGLDARKLEYHPEEDYYYGGNLFGKGNLLVVTGKASPKLYMHPWKTERDLRLEQNEYYYSLPREEGWKTDLSKPLSPVDPVAEAYLTYGSLIKPGSMALKKIFSKFPTANWKGDAVKLTKDRLSNGGFERLELAHNKNIKSFESVPDDLSDIPVGMLKNNELPLHYSAQDKMKILKTDVYEVPSWYATGNPRHIGVSNSLLGPVLYSDRPYQYLQKLATSDIAAHEFSHFVYTPSEKISSEIFKPVTGYGKYFTKQLSAEVAARGTQIKNYFGMREGDIITLDHLKYAKKNFVKDRGYDNGMTEFFNSIKDYKKVADWLTKNAPVAVIPAISYPIIQNTTE